MVSREGLSVWLAYNESGASCLEVFVELSKRKLKDVRYAVFDDNEGLATTTERHLQEDTWRRFQVHCIPSVLNLVCWKDRADVGVHEVDRGWECWFYRNAPEVTG